MWEKGLHQGAVHLVKWGQKYFHYHVDLNKHGGRSRRAHPPTPIFRPNWGPKGQKIYYWEIPPTSPQNLDDCSLPPPPYLMVWICNWNRTGCDHDCETNTAAFTQKRHSGSKAWEEGMCVIRSYCKWFLTKILILPCIFEKMHKTDWTENLAVYWTWPLIHPPPSGSTANILVALLPLSFMLAATPETRPPPPQHTITTSGFGISSNISTPALAIE